MMQIYEARTRHNSKCSEKTQIESKQILVEMNLIKESLIIDTDNLNNKISITVFICIIQCFKFNISNYFLFNK